MMLSLHHVSVKYYFFFFVDFLTVFLAVVFFAAFTGFFTTAFFAAGFLTGAFFFFATAASIASSLSFASFDAAVRDFSAAASISYALPFFLSGSFKPFNCAILDSAR